MATDRQIAANRANALKSTGPRTPEGKAASSANALKSGIYARDTVVAGEDPARLEALRDSLYETHRPEHADERILVDSIISNAWSLERLRKCQTQLWDRMMRTGEQNYDPAHNLSNAFPRNEDHFIKLQRLINAADRGFHRALTGLLRLQKERRPLPNVESKPASPKLGSFRQKPSPPRPPLITPSPQPIGSSVTLIFDSNAQPDTALYTEPIEALNRRKHGG